MLVNNDSYQNEHEAEQKLIAAVQQNDLVDIKSIVATSPHLLKSNPKILVNAASEEALWLLLNCHPNSLNRWHPRVTGETEGVDNFHEKCIGNLVNNSNIRECFPTLVKTFPDIAKQILDLFVHSHGICPDDPNLRVTLFQDLFMNSDQSMNYMPLYRIAKYPKTYLLMHPVVKSLVYSEKTFSWIQTIIVIFLALFCTLFLCTSVYTLTRQDVCDTYNGPIFLVSITKYLTYSCSAVLILYEVFCIATLRLDYLRFGYHIFQWFVVFFCYFSTLYGTTFWDMLTIALVWLNVMFRLQQTRIFGLYILTFLMIAKRFLQITLPVIFFCLLIALCVFMVYYPAETNTKIKALLAASATLTSECAFNYAYSSKFFGFSHPLDIAMRKDNYDTDFLAKKFVKAFAQALGNIESNDILLNNNVNATRTIVVILILCTMAIIFTNLLIGLTVGDVKIIAQEANQIMVSIDIISIYEIYFFRQHYLKKISEKLASKIPLVTIEPHKEALNPVVRIIQDVYMPSYTLSAKTLKTDALRAAEEIFETQKP